LESIDWTQVSELHKTKDAKEANRMIREGWKLADVTRGNMDHSFLLVRMD